MYNTLFPTFLGLKVRGTYYSEQLNVNFLSSYVHYHIQDEMTEYLWSKLTNV